MTVTGKFGVCEEESPPISLDSRFALLYLVVRSSEMENRPKDLCCLAKVVDRLIVSLWTCKEPGSCFRLATRGRRNTGLRQTGWVEMRKLL